MTYLSGGQSVALGLEAFGCGGNVGYFLTGNRTSFGSLETNARVTQGGSLNNKEKKIKVTETVKLANVSGQLSDQQ